MKIGTMLKKRMLIASVTVVLLMSGCGKSDTTNDASNTASSIEIENSVSDSSASLDNSKESESSSLGNLAEEKESATTMDSSIAISDNSSEMASDSKDTQSADSTKNSDKTKEADKTKESDKSKETDKTKESDKTKEAAKTENTENTQETSKPQENSNQEATTKAEETTQPQQPQKVDYGRILFVGDSRTVDMFDAGASSFYGRDEGGVTVYCQNGGNFGFFIDTVEGVKLENFDTLVTWMGCNDRGSFGDYENYYNYLLSMGKTIVVCTVGPTEDQYLVDEYDQTYYVNSLMVAYNNSLVSWANAHGVKVIDLYSYLSGNSAYYLDPADGIHFQQQPTYGIWTYIFSQM